MYSPDSTIWKASRTGATMNEKWWNISPWQVYTYQQKSLILWCFPSSISTPRLLWCATCKPATEQSTTWEGSSRRIEPCCSSHWVPQFSPTGDPTNPHNKGLMRYSQQHWQGSLLSYGQLRQLRQVARAKPTVKRLTNLQTRHGSWPSETIPITTGHTQFTQHGPILMMTHFAA